MGEQRFPLLIGIHSFRLLAIMPAWILLGLAATQTLSVVGPDLPFSSVTRVIGAFGLVASLGLCVSPIALVIMAMVGFDRLKRAFKQRACDLFLGKDGIRIVGGFADGFRASYSTLGQPEAVRWLPFEGLWLRGDSGASIHLRLPADTEERASIEALAATLSARAATKRAERSSPPRRFPEGTILCVGCGAAQSPVEAPSKSCPYCQTNNPIPQELVAKIHAMRIVSRARAGEDRMMTALVSQRGAISANVVAFAGAALVIAVTAITVFTTVIVFMYSVFTNVRDTGLPRIGGLGVAEAGVGLGLIGVVAWLLADRSALRLLTVGFAAIAPSREGEPLACRSCGGPLPEPDPGSAVARCVYCAAPNVMAADLQLESAIVERFGKIGQDPAVVLATCARRRRAARVAVGSGAALFVAGCLWLFMLSRSTEVRRDSAAFIAFDAATQPTIGRIRRGPGAVSVERMGTLSKGDARLLPDASATADGGFAFANAEGLFTRDRGGKVTHIYPVAWYQDRLVVDVASRGEDFILATTRASRQGHHRIQRIGRDGSTEVVLDDAREPAISPDGSRLAAAYLIGERFQVVTTTMRRPGSIEQLTRGEGQVAFPTWSPDGRRLAFLSDTITDAIHGRSSGEIQLWIVDEEGHSSQLTEGDRSAAGSTPSLQLAPPVWTSEGIWVVGRDAENRGVLMTVLWKVIPK